MSTDTPTVELDEYAKLENYSAAAREFRAAEDALKDVQSLIDARDAARESVRTAVDALGSDPFGILKGKRNGQLGPRRPADPDRKSKVVDAFSTPKSVAAVSDETGEPKNYINSILQQARNGQGGMTLETSGEKPRLYVIAKAA